MAKQKKNKKDRSGIVYSTDPDYDYDPDDEMEEETLAPSKQDLRVTIDRLKGNKKATRIYQFVGSDEDLKDLAKELKQICACGGGAKNGEIILQGDFRQKLEKALKDKGYRYKWVGG